MKYYLDVYDRLTVSILFMADSGQRWSVLFVSVKNHEPEYSRKHDIASLSDLYISQ